MLDLKLISSQPELVQASLKKRGFKDPKEAVEAILVLDKKRKEGIQAGEVLKQQRNEASIQIAKLKKEKGDATALLEKMKSVADEIKKTDDLLSVVQQEINTRLLEMPNLLDAAVPEGTSAEQNKVVKSWGEKPQFNFEPKSHFDLGEKLGILDFERAGKVTGARFTFVRGLAAELELALIQFMVKHHRSRGYEAIIPPFIVNSASLQGTGQFPKFKEDVFHLEGTDYHLIPTAEVPVTNYFRDEILEESLLPKKFVAYSPCFRSEAGSYGKDTKGLKRQHQFNKVELVKFARPEQSMQELESLLGDAEAILQSLGLAYRVVLLCAGDIGFGSAKTYDIEVWSPFANAYMEISSCSNFGDYQARRAQIRYREASTKKVQPVHTLNGSGLAVGRTLIAIMENFQKADGTFTIPAALQPYL